MYCTKVNYDNYYDYMHVPEHMSCSSGKVVNEATVFLQTLFNGVSYLLTPATHKTCDYYMTILQHNIQKYM